MPHQYRDFVRITRSVGRNGNFDSGVSSEPTIVYIYTHPHTHTHTHTHGERDRDMTIDVPTVIRCLCTFVSFLVAVALLCYIYIIYGNKMTTSPVVDYAVEKSAFAPTVFQIYDRSTNRVCDRLIIVRPFDWTVWACRGELYVLNPESGFSCGPNTTPAVRVYAEQFVPICLKIPYDSILNHYRSRPCKHVPYEFDGPTFTILSALNILVRDWIYFNLEVTKTSNDDSYYRRYKKRDRRSTTNTDGNNSDDDDDDDDRPSLMRLGRKFLLDRVTHSQLQEIVIGNRPTRLLHGHKKDLESLTVRPKLESRPNVEP